ncbi:MAG: class I SAM-dependent methyltransferase [Thermodesulfobacteriota bacterium]
MKKALHRLAVSVSAFPVASRLIETAKSAIRHLLRELYHRVTSLKRSLAACFVLLDDLKRRLAALESQVAALQPTLSIATPSPASSGRLDREGDEPTLARPVSQLCTQSQVDSEIYALWREALRLDGGYRRKYWEYVYILQALQSLGQIAAGKTGLGFGVGQEPLSAYLAAQGCHVVATDMQSGGGSAGKWAETGQHAASADHLNVHGICPPGLFQRNVHFRVVDMNAMPEDLAGFDFVWSSCAMEHLGSLERGMTFLRRSLSCLKPGGVAVHTTEFNVYSDDTTVDFGPTVLFRKKDIEAIRQEMVALGHAMAVNYHPGNGPLDFFVDFEPCGDPHLKYLVSGYVTTSFGIIIQKGRGIP